MRRFLLVGLGFALVLGARLLVRPSALAAQENATSPAGDAVPPVNPPPVASTARAEEEAAADPACAELHASVSERLDQIQAAADQIRDFERLLSGEPVPWRDDLPATVREDAVRQILEAAAEATPHSLVLKDLLCEEYPCMGIIEVVTDDLPSRWFTEQYSSDLAKTLEELVKGEGIEITPLGSWRPGGTSKHHVSVALHVPGLGDAERSRLRHRMHDYKIDGTGMRWLPHFAQ